MVSAEEHPEAVMQYLKEEVEKGRVVRLDHKETEARGIQVSPFRVRQVEINTRPVITSVNNGIAKDWPH